MIDYKDTPKSVLLETGNELADFLVPLGLIAPHAAELYANIMHSKDSTNLQLSLLLYTVLSQLDIDKIDNEENELKGYQTTITECLITELKRIYAEKALPKIIEKIDNEIVPSINILLNKPSEDDTLKQFKDKANVLLTIPNKIHGVWLGKLPNQAIRDNLVDFAKKNPACQVFLWIDSGTYPESNTIDEWPEWNVLKAWAKENNIMICDINPQANNLADNNIVFNRADIYLNSSNKDDYDFQLNGKDCNYSAACDIVRGNILENEGGFYADCNDVYPNNPINNLYAPNGFFINFKIVNKISFYNTDIFASVPGGKFVDTYQRKSKEGYRKLFKKDTSEIHAHRNSHYGNTIKSIDSRKSAVMSLGPEIIGPLTKGMKDYGISFEYFYLSRMHFDTYIIDDINPKELHTITQNFNKNTLLITKTNGALKNCFIPLIMTTKTHEVIIKNIEELDFCWPESFFDTGCYLFSITDKKLFVFFGEFNEENQSIKAKEVILENEEKVYESLVLHCEKQSHSLAKMNNSDYTTKINADELSEIIGIDAETQKPYIAPILLDTKVYVICGGYFPAVYYFDSNFDDLKSDIKKLMEQSEEAGKVIRNKENSLIIDQIINNFIKQSQTLFKISTPESIQMFFPFILPEQGHSWYKYSPDSPIDIKEILPLMRHTIWNFFYTSLKNSYNNKIKNNNTINFFTPAIFDQLEKSIKLMLNRMVDISPDKTLSEMFAYCFQEISDFEQLNNFFMGAIKKLERCCRSFDQLFSEENVIAAGMSPAGIKRVFDFIDYRGIQWITGNILDCEEIPDHHILIERYPDCCRNDFIIFKK